MSEPAAVYLLEAYAAPDGGHPASADDLRAEIEALDGVRVIGLVVVPVDEAILCLVTTESSASEAAVLEVADRYGPAARLLHVSWAPTVSPELDASPS